MIVQNYPKAQLCFKKVIEIRMSIYPSSKETWLKPMQSLAQAYRLDKQFSNCAEEIKAILELCTELLANPNLDSVKRFNVMVIKSEVLYLRRSLEFEIIKDFKIALATLEELIKS